MTDFFTSDLHFGHKNIVRYCNRPTTVELHTSWLIDQMNSVVKANDNVYHLGDFSFYTKPEQIAEMLYALNGNWNFILGNHDDTQRLSKAVALTSGDRFRIVGNYLRTTFEDTPTVLFHFPIEEWDRKEHGSLHLHGHMHAVPTAPIGNRFDVGVDCHPDHIPFVFSDFKSKMVEGSRQRSASYRKE